MARIFINYRRQDSEGYVGRLYDHLTRHFDGETLFLDVDSIPPGVDFVEFLDDAVAQCDVLLAVIGPNWANISDEAGERRILREDDFVRIEIASALRQKKTVVLGCASTKYRVPMNMSVLPMAATQCRH